ncbi:MAG: heavy metal sensor histidine kinase [Verrucomicrobiales bacterium]|nr:heavy metal sensor histidine kinase [Verrucomicrobiales bacterium]
MTPSPPSSSGSLPTTWWKRRSLKLRLAFWFALIACLLLLSLLPFVYVSIGRQLNTDIDRQLAIDWSLIEAHLESDEQGGIRWKKDSPSTLERGGYAESWFDVWSDTAPLMSHWPRHGVRMETPPRPGESGVGYYDLTFSGNRPARTLQKPASISGRPLTLRVFLDKTRLQQTLHGILTGLVLGVPIAVLLAAAGGYYMAGRALRPIVEMTRQARQITSESLSQRLPNPNPHDELGRLAQVFNETLERLEKSFSSLRQFTADASHELRTPLTALKSVGEVSLRETREPDALRDTIASMLEEAHRLHELTDTLLLLTRAESGRLPIHTEIVAAAEVVEEVVDRLEVVAAEKSQRLDVSIMPGFIVTADAVLLRQALMNLVHNAIRYSPSETTIRVSCFSEGTEAVIEVTDQGPGIAPEHQERIFERFYRIDRARSRAEGGTGLGLAIARTSIEMFGGTIALRSEPGVGSRFQVRLPLRDQTGESRTART